MKKFVMILISVLLCVFCFGCTAANQESENTESGSGIVTADPYEAVSNPTETPAFIFMASLAGLIAVSATVVLIRDARRKTSGTNE